MNGRGDNASGVGHFPLTAYPIMLFILFVYKIKQSLVLCYTDITVFSYAKLIQGYTFQVWHYFNIEHCHYFYTAIQTLLFNGL